MTQQIWLYFQKTYNKFITDPNFMNVFFFCVCVFFLFFLWKCSLCSTHSIMRAVEIIGGEDCHDIHVFLFFVFFSQVYVNLWPWLYISMNNTEEMNWTLREWNTTPYMFGAGGWELQNDSLMDSYFSLVGSFVLPVATIIPGAELLVEIVPDK